jgi:BirA family biotin operon repressor/biotin-[acetyl-CoA-carboxylase] ligase
LSTVESTNNYAMAKLHAGMVDHGVCFLALRQTAGKGQRGKKWASEPGENITMSTVLAPAKSDAARLSAHPFLLSASVALACYDFIKDYQAGELSIKWPNDIYIGDRKAAGILIENIYKGGSYTWAVAGTGVNINQEAFTFEGSRAVSLKMITGTTYDVVRMGRHLHQCLLDRFGSLAENGKNLLDEYNSCLYRRNQEVRLKKESIVFTARISHVSESGELITSGAIEQAFKVGEVEFA